MNWKLILVVGGFSLMVACQEKEVPYQLSDETWVKVLADLHLSESATQHLSLSMRDSMVSFYLDQILEIHEVEATVFEPEYNRLKKDPAKLSLLYSSVAKRLNELKLKQKEKVDEAVSTKKK